MNQQRTLSVCLRVGLALLGACSSQIGSDPQPLPSPSSLAAEEKASVATTAPGWSSAGNGINNTRNQPSERTLGPDAARKLAPRWVADTMGDVWATPAVDETSVYVPDAAGYLSSLDRGTGKARWSRRVTEYTGAPNDFARTTPALLGDTLYLGNQAGRSGNGSAAVFAVDKRTGAKLWSTSVDPHPASIITASPVVHGNRVYVGVSSYEEFRAPGPYECCSFRGSVVALDRHSGALLWKTYMTPNLPGYTGVGVWGSTPVVDPGRNSLYVATGNNYTVPTAVLDCTSLPTPAEVATCIAEVPGEEENYIDSVLSLDLDDGKVKWVHRASSYDSFNGACIVPNSPECRKPVGKDYDFGQGPLLYTTQVNGKDRQLLGAGQKSGVFWALDPDDGAVVWSTQVGPGGIYGGLEWGSATDGKRIYTALANSEGQPWTLPSGEVTRSGLWAALDAATGKIVWQTRGTPAVLASARGAVSVANGVVYGGTFDGAGMLYALDASTGATLWTFVSNGTVVAAPAIVDGTLYWASGYVSFGGTGGRTKKLYAFAPSTQADAGAAAPVDAGAPPGVLMPDVSTWAGLYGAYFGPGSVGHCTNCHSELGSADAAYDFLREKGQIDGTNSKLVKEGSQLTWFGGNMPPAGPTSYPEAERDLRAWVASGARR